MERAFAPAEIKRCALRPLQTGAALAVCLLMLWPDSRAQEKDRGATAGGAVATEMRNVHYHFTDNIIVHIRRLNGRLVPSQSDGFPIFDEKNSFTLDIDSAEIAITTTDLANLLNDYVFADTKSHLKDIKVGAEKNQIKLTGKLHRGVDVPFETLGRLLDAGRANSHTSHQGESRSYPGEGLHGSIRRGSGRPD